MKIFFTALLSFITLSSFFASVQGAKLNAAGVSLIEEFEGYRSDFYTDATGHKTICYGYNCDAHDCSGLRPPLSKARCTTLLESTLKTYEDCACAMKGMAKANANEYAGLVSFAYNAGCGSLQSTFPGAVAKGNFAGIADVLPKTNTLNGLPGLVRRRKAEAALMRKPTSAKSGC